MELRDQDEKIREMEVEGASKLWVGKDYVNFIYKDFVELDMPFHGIHFYAAFIFLPQVSDLQIVQLKTLSIVVLLLGCHGTIFTQ